MAEMTAPLRILLKKSTVYHWSDAQEQAFQNLKNILVNPPVLSNFNKDLPLVIQTDCSQFGIGCCLLQNNKPVAFASRSLNESEIKYPQIEKEALAIQFACRKYHNYIWGNEVTVQTDHLPLISIFKKNICNIASERISKIRLMLHRYNLNVIYLPGKEMVIADLLSRNFIQETYDNEIPLEGFVHNIYQEIPLMSTELISEKTVTDQNLCDVIHYCNNGWPKTKDNFPVDDLFVKHFYNLRNELIVENNLLYYNNRIVIPRELRDKALSVLHEGYMGVTKNIAQGKPNILLDWD